MRGLARFMMEGETLDRAGGKETSETNPSDVGGQGLDFAFFCTAVCEARECVLSVKLVKLSD